MISFETIQATERTGTREKIQGYLITYKKEAPLIVYTKSELNREIKENKKNIVKIEEGYY